MNTANGGSLVHYRAVVFSLFSGGKPQGCIPVAGGTPRMHSSGSQNPKDAFQWLAEPQGCIPVARGTPRMHSSGWRNPKDAFQWLAEPQGCIPVARGTPRMHSSGSRNPCSHFCTGKLRHTVDRCICITSGGTLVENHCYREKCRNFSASPR